MSLRRRAYELLELDRPDDRWARAVKLGIGAIIVANVVGLVLESHLEPGDPRLAWLDALEAFSVAVFTVEYAVRLWTAVEQPEYSAPVSGRLRYALTPLVVVDLLAILPFFLPMVIAADLRVMRVLRLFRLGRVLKLGHYSASLQLLARIIQRSKHDLASCIFLIAVLLVLAASLMYYAETDAQPEAFSSITGALWWGIATLSTVGYGDIVPVTHLGKVLGAVVAMLGIGLFALPAGIIASAYVEELKSRADRPACPHCGKSPGEVVDGSRPVAEMSPEAGGGEEV
jgi:voltage-gated potassium channel